MLNVDGVTIAGAGNGTDPAKDTILSFKGAATRRHPGRQRQRASR